MGDDCTPVEMEQHLEAILVASRDMVGDYNKMFTMGEMMATVSNLKCTSPGFDNIHNKIIKNLPVDLYPILLYLFNRVWLEGSIPKCWKVAMILPTHKFGKSQRLPSSYRLISLLSCLGKVLERMVRCRLY